MERAYLQQKHVDITHKKEEKSKKMLMNKAQLASRLPAYGRQAYMKNQ
jgi:hypothetical protein